MAKGKSHGLVLEQSQPRQGVFFFQIRVSHGHLHITIYLTMGKIDCIYSPNSKIIKNNITLTS